MFLKTVVRHSSTTMTAIPEIMDASGVRAPHELLTAVLQLCTGTGYRRILHDMSCRGEQIDTAVRSTRWLHNEKAPRLVCNVRAGPAHREKEPVVV